MPVSDTLTRSLAIASQQKRLGHDTATRTDQADGTIDAIKAADRRRGRAEAQVKHLQALREKQELQQARQKAAFEQAATRKQRVFDRELNKAQAAAEQQNATIAAQASTILELEQQVAQLPECYWLLHLRRKALSPLMSLLTGWRLSNTRRTEG